MYPYEHFNLRTEEETRVHVQQALDTRVAVCRVKGPTVLSSIVHENIRAVTIDPMHCVSEGIVKKLMELWFSSKFAERPFSLVRNLDLVDKRLKALTPPSYVSRLPRSISKNLSYWKAHELQAWLHYYSLPCISDIMDIIIQSLLIHHSRNITVVPNVSIPTGHRHCFSRSERIGVSV